jgi:hypothetical protein
MVIDELKARARVLHRKAQSGEPDALVRLRKVEELSELDDATLIARVRRRHCLGALALEMGFPGWPDALAAFEGSASDFGTLLYPSAFGGGHWNIWSASYEEARAIREEHGGYLLGYRRQFFVTDRYFIESLGLDPDDPDWARIGRDWIRPSDPEARNRLYAALVRRQLAAA